MSIGAKSLLAAAALVFASAAAAEMDTATKLRLQSIEARLPDVDRLAALEKRVERLAQAQGGAAGESSAVGAGGSSMFSLLQDVQSLQEEVRSLRGQVERLQHELRESKQRQQDLYQDLDERLLAVEQQLGISTSAGAQAGSRETSGGQAAPPDNPEEAEKAYLAAFEKLKQGNYSQAADAFDQFVQRYPNSQYSDNAWYWLGEAHYVDREYGPALEALRHVINDFPNSDKVPDALYKIGVIHDEQGDYGQARTTLNKVTSRYAESKAAELARKRLQAIDKAQGDGGGN